MKHRRMGASRDPGGLSMMETEKESYQAFPKLYLPSESEESGSFAFSFLNSSTLKTILR